MTNEIAIRTKIRKHYTKMTNTEKYIANQIINNPELIKLGTIREIAESTSSAVTTIHRFVNKIGFKNVFELKHWIIQQEIEQLDDARLINDLKVTLNRYNSIEIKSLVSDIKIAKKIFIYARGSSKAVAQSLERKLLKLGFDARFVSSSDYDIYSKKKSSLWFFVSISGRTFVKLQNKDSEAVLITSTKPDLKIAGLFKYVFYAYTKQDFLLSEFDFPLDTEILVLFVVNALISKIKLELD